MADERDWNYLAQAQRQPTMANLLMGVEDRVKNRGMLLPFVEMESGKAEVGVPGFLHEPWQALNRLMAYAPGTKDESAVKDSATLAGALMTGGLGLNWAGQVPKGALGIFGGRLAQTADHAALAKAEEMASKGAPREQIWNETGWFQGKDGKWRFEIDDRNAFVDLKRDGDFYRSSGQGLGEESPFRHPDVARAYDANKLMWRMDPEASYMSGSFSEGAPATATYKAVDPQITVKAKDEWGLRSPALHELQHFIQRQEGFAKGDSFSRQNIDDIKVKALRPYDDQINDLMQNYPDVAEAFRARNRKQAEIRGRNPTEADMAEMDRLDAILQSTGPGRQLDRLDWERMSLSSNPEEHWKDLAFQQYQRSAGETEARNVEARAAMAPQERRAKPPWETQDVPDDLQILRFR